MEPNEPILWYGAGRNGKLGRGLKEMGIWRQQKMAENLNKGQPQEAGKCWEMQKKNNGTVKGGHPT